MSHANDSSRQVATASDGSPDKLLDRFRAAWQSAERPNLDDFLAHAGGDRLAGLLCLAREDLAQRLAHGESPHSEEYFGRYPELSANSAAATDLIVAEFAQRSARGMGSSVDVYLNRFPQFGTLLATQLECEHTKRVSQIAIETSTIHDKATVNFEGRTDDDATVDWVQRASLSDDAEQQPPQIAGYADLKYIARGGMGFVLKARHLALDRLVAIKMPLARHITCDEDRERFLREARNTARLRHPQICAIHEVGEAAGRPYIAMDFIRGETLRDWAKRCTPPARKVSEIMAILARAVGYAHEHGVIHRDLKPGNVMVDEDSGEPMLMDFGLAKEISDESQLTQSGQVLGTPDYMSPEQAAGHMEEVGPLSDVYSLGAILYVLLCQRPPFKGTVGEVLRQVQADEPIAPRKINPRIHRDLETVCLKALAKDPARRYSSAIALAEDLERFSAGDAILARREGLTGRLWRKVRHSPITTVVLVAVLGTSCLAAYIGAKARANRQVTTLLSNVAAGLDTDEWSAEHLRSMEALVVELRPLDEAQAASAQQRLRQRLAEAINRAIRSERLQDADSQRIEQMIQLLAERDADAAPRLRRALAERMRVWESVVDLTPKDGLKEIFSPTDVRVKNDSFLPQPGLLAGEATHARVGSGGNVRMEVVFQPSWTSARQVGLVLNSNQGHAQRILSLAPSPDGKLLATVSTDQTVKLWNLATDDVVFSFALRRAPMSWIAFTPDGKTLLAAHSELLAWDVATGEPKRLDAKVGPCKSLALSKDGRTLAVLDPKGDVKLWDFVELRPRPVRIAGESAIDRMALSPDGRQLATASQQGAAQVWDCGDGRSLWKIADTAKRVTSLEFSDDGGTLVCALDNVNQLQLWDTASHALRHSLAHLAWKPAPMSSSGKTLVTFWNPVVRWHDMATGAVRKELPIEHTMIEAASMGSDGETLVYSDKRGCIHFVDLHSGKERKLLCNHHYSFLVHLPEPTAGEPLDPANHGAPTIERAIEAGGKLILEIQRDGEQLQSREIAAAQIAGSPLQLSAAREDNRLILQAGDLPPVEFSDVFPISRARPGVVGIVWPDGVGIERLKVTRQTSPRAASRLERGDELYERGQIAEALAEYRQQQIASADTVAGQEARYKSALCLLALGRTDEGQQLLERLGVESGDRWPMLAGYQLWMSQLERENWKEAESIFESLSLRYNFQQPMALIPGYLRDRIIHHYEARSSGVDFYLPKPERIVQLERAVSVRDLLSGRMFSTKWGCHWKLLRAYHVAGKLERAKEFAAAGLKDVDPNGPDISTQWIAEYAWLLRTGGQAPEALALIDHWLFEPSGAYRTSYLPLLVERARCLVALERWDEAEHALEEASRREGVRESPIFFTAGCLLHGFLRERKGDREGALAAWRAGLDARNASVDTTSGLVFLHHLILGALTDGLSQADLAKAQASLFASFTANSVGSFLTTTAQFPVTGLRDMWLTPRGREAARQIAYQELPFAKEVSLAPILVGSHLLRTGAYGGNMPLEDEEVAWGLLDDAYAAFASGKVSAPQILAFGMTWKGTTNVLGWSGLANSLEPGIRGPAAYLYGQRYLRHYKQPAEAVKFFRTALKDAVPGSLLSRLAQAQLDQLAPQ